MRDSIKECFANIGCLAKCRTDEFYQEARLEMPASEHVSASLDLITSEAANVPENIDCNEVKEDDNEEQDTTTEGQKQCNDNTCSVVVNAVEHGVGDIDSTEDKAAAENNLTLRIASAVWKNRSKNGRVANRKI